MNMDDKELDMLFNAIANMIDNGTIQFDENGDMVGHLDIDLRETEKK